MESPGHEKEKNRLMYGHLHTVYHWIVKKIQTEYGLLLLVSWFMYTMVLCAANSLSRSKMYDDLREAFIL